MGLLFRRQRLTLPTPVVEDADLRHETAYAYPELRYANDHKPDDQLRGSQWRAALFNCMIDEATGTYLSEDFSFCRRWTDMGGEIWADLQSRLTHVGTVSFDGDVATQFSPVAASD